MNSQIALFVLIAVQFSDSSYSPFGVKMCELLCQQTEDCTLFGHSQINLACILKNPVPVGDVKVCNITRKHSTSCPSQSRVVLDRKGHETCIELTPRTKILAVHLFSGQTTKASLVDPQTGLTRSYEEINIPKVKSIEYLSSIRTLVVTRESQHFYQIELMSLTNRSSPIITLKRQVRKEQVAVDNDQLLVFFTIEAYPHLSVHCINAVTSKETEVMKVIGTTVTVLVAVDAFRNCLYVHAQKRITSVSYDGSNKRNVKRHCRYVNAIVVGNNGNFLYYNRMKDLYQVSVAGKVVSKLGTLSIWMRIMIIFDRKLFIGFSSEIHEFDLKRKKFSLLAEVRGVHGPVHYDMCLIE